MVLKYLLVEVNYTHKQLPQFLKIFFQCDTLQNTRPNNAKSFF